MRLDAAFDDLGVLLRGAACVGGVLKPARGEHNCAQRVANIVTDDRENPLFEVAREGELLLIVLLLRVLRPAPLVDVHTAADESREAPGVVRERNAAIEDPPIHAVVTAKAVLHFERFAAVEVVEIVRDTPVEIVGVDALCPAVAHLLFERAPREREPGFVEIVALGVEAGAPDHDRRMLDEETVFRGRQRPTHERDYTPRAPNTRLRVPNPPTVVAVELVQGPSPSGAGRRSLLPSVRTK